jgi:hypothetical protein
MFSVLRPRQEQVMAKLVRLAGGERQLEAAMRYVTRGQGGRVDECELIDYLMKRRRAAGRIAARMHAPEPVI